MRPAWQSPIYEPVSVALGAFVTLTNVGAAYDTTTAARGLGLVRLDFTNVQSVEFGVWVSKVGTGTQSWQLWDVTGASQLAVIDDAGATGDKLLTTTVASGLPTGLRLVRVRCKSTVAADDPLYFGSYVLLT